MFNQGESVGKLIVDLEKVNYKCKDIPMQGHTFVANCVHKIHRSTTPQQWSYIPSNEIHLITCPEA